MDTLGEAPPPVAGIRVTFRGVGSATTRLSGLWFGVSGFYPCAQTQVRVSPPAVFKHLILVQFETAFLEATETFYHEEGNAMINQVTSLKSSTLNPQPKYPQSWPFTLNLGP